MIYSVLEYCKKLMHIQAKQKKLIVLSHLVSKNVFLLYVY